MWAAKFYPGDVHGQATEGGSHTCRRLQTQRHRKAGTETAASCAKSLVRAREISEVNIA